MWMIVEETRVEMLVSKFTPKQWLHPGVENEACNAKARHRRAAERGMGNEQEVGNRGGERPTATDRGILGERGKSPSAPSSQSLPRPRTLFLAGQSGAVCTGA